MIEAVYSRLHTLDMVHFEELDVCKEFTVKMDQILAKQRPV